MSIDTPSDKPISRQAATGVLAEAEIEAVIAQAAQSPELAGKRVLVIIPDATRTMPLPLFFRLLGKHLLPRTRGLDYLVALGTHPAMSEAALLALVGVSAEEKQARYPSVRLLNHAWDDPDALTVLGQIPADEIAALSDGRLRRTCRCD